jgi:hypothetical protein
MYKPKIIEECKNRETVHFNPWYWLGEVIYKN